VSAKTKFAVPERIYKPMWLRQVGVQKLSGGVKRMKQVLGYLSMAALAVLLAPPVSAQIIKLKATVPFDFAVDGHTMPAGDYVVTTDDVRVLALQNVHGGAPPTFILSNPPDGPGDRGEAFLAFHRYGGDYFLAKIWDGYTAQGRSIRISPAEQERANRASINKPEVVMVLARR
jgi:hypothetical protein